MLHDLRDMLLFISLMVTEFGKLHYQIRFQLEIMFWFWLLDALHMGGPKWPEKWEYKLIFLILARIKL